MTTHDLHSLWLRRATFAGAVLLSACTAAGESDTPNADSTDQLEDSLISSTAEYTTQNTGLLPLSGYNELFDRATDTCLTTNTPGGPKAPVNIGSDTDRVSLTYVQSSQELAQSLGIDASLSVKYKVVDANASFGLHRNSSMKSDKYYMLLKVDKSYMARVSEPATFNDPALADQLKAGAPTYNPENFMAGCGHVYAKGVRYGAHLFVLYEFSKMEESKWQKVQAALNVAIKAGPVGGAVNAAYEQEVKEAMSGVQVNVQIAAKGFRYGVGSVENQKTKISEFLTGFNMAAIDDVFRQMVQSVSEDRGKDVADFWQAGKMTSVTPEGIEPAFYAPRLPAAFDKIKPERDMITSMQGLLQYLRPLSTMGDRLVAANAEANAFLTAESPHWYNVVPPGAPVTTTVDELRAKVQPFKAQLDEKTPESPAYKLQVLGEQCWTKATAGDYTGCKFPDADPVNSTEYKAAKDVLDRYNAGARALPLNYFVVSGKYTYASAMSRCQQDGYRLPNENEVQLMSLVQKNANYLADGAYFVNTPNADCNTAEGFPYSFYKSDATWGCGQSGYEINGALCVPWSGPVPNTPAP